VSLFVLQVPKTYLDISYEWLQCMPAANPTYLSPIVECVDSVKQVIEDNVNDKKTCGDLIAKMETILQLLKDKLSSTEDVTNDTTAENVHSAVTETGKEVTKGELSDGIELDCGSGRDIVTGAKVKAEVDDNIDEVEDIHTVGTDVTDLHDGNEGTLGVVDCESATEKAAIVEIETVPVEPLIEIKEDYHSCSDTDIEEEIHRTIIKQSPR